MNTIGTNPTTGLYTFFDTTGVPLANGWVTTYLAGTTTPQATYATQDTTGAVNANPLQLNSVGQAVMFFAPVVSGSPECVAYKMLLQADNAGVPGATIAGYPIDHVAVPAPSASANLSSAVVGYGTVTTLSIAGGVLSPTKNIHLATGEGGMADNLDTITTTALPDGSVLVLGNSSGAAAITVRNAIGNILLAGAASMTLTATTDRLTLYRVGANWVEITRSPSVAASASANTACFGRLTLTTAVPFTTADVTSSTLYWTPCQGNTVALYNGATWDLVTFAEINIAAPATSDVNYDVFVYNNGGTAALELLAWTNLTTRATGIQRLSGVYVKASDFTRRYLGTISTTASTFKDTAALRYLWNYYNRIAKPLLRLETTATWTYNTAAYRQANNSALNQVVVMIGVVEDLMELAVRGAISETDATQEVYVSIGLNSITPNLGAVGQLGTVGWTGSGITTPSCAVTVFPAIGRNTYSWLEYGPSSGTGTWYGTAGAATLIQTGLYGTVKC